MNYVQVGLVCLLMCGCGKQPVEHPIPEAALVALQQATHFELLSLDPEHLEGPPPDAFHRFRVIGRTNITDAAIRQQLVATLEAGAHHHGKTAVACFFPRHGVHVIENNMAYDFVICFQCDKTLVYQDGIPFGDFGVTKAPQATFDRVLIQAKVALPSY